MVIAKNGFTQKKNKNKKCEHGRNHLEWFQGYHHLHMTLQTSNQQFPYTEKKNSLIQHLNSRLLVLS